MNNIKLGILTHYLASVDAVLNLEWTGGQLTESRQIAANEAKMAIIDLLTETAVTTLTNPDITGNG